MGCVVERGAGCDVVIDLDVELDENVARGGRNLAGRETIVGERIEMGRVPCERLSGDGGCSDCVTRCHGKTAGIRNPCWEEVSEGNVAGGDGGVIEHY